MNLTCESDQQIAPIEQISLKLCCFGDCYLGLYLTAQYRPPSTTYRRRPIHTFLSGILSPTRSASTQSRQNGVWISKYLCFLSTPISFVSSRPSSFSEARNSFWAYNHNTSLKTSVSCVSMWCALSPYVLRCRQNSAPTHLADCCVLVSASQSASARAAAKL